MASTVSAASDSTAASQTSNVLRFVSVTIPPVGDTLSSTTDSAPSSMAPSSGISVSAPLSQALHSVSIKALVLYTLDMETYNYTKWHTLFSMVLDWFNLLDDAAHLTDLEWTKDDLLVGHWIYSTISKKLLDMCLRLDRPTARKIWVYLGDLFTGNKSSRVVHLECELHNLVQEEISANDFCHRLEQPANSHADCDVSMDDRALVHQLICGLNPKFSVLSTLLPLLPKFPTFVEAHELVLNDEASHAADSKRTSKTALLVAGVSTTKQDTTPLPPPAPDRPPPLTTNNNSGGRSRGGRNGGHGGGGCNNFNNAPGWGKPWGSN
jgi:hypothetical protein